MAKKDRTADVAGERDREKWMARFQVRLAVQPGVDRAVVLEAVKGVTAHCAGTGSTRGLPSAIRMPVPCRPPRPWCRRTGRRVRGGTTPWWTRSAPC